MHINCPHCRNAIEIVPSQPLEMLTCPSCGSSINLLSPDTLPYREVAQKRIGRFSLIDLLGSGHFGDVWKAKDPELDRFVALKLPRKEELLQEDVEVFLREARAAAQLKHANIVGVHEIGRDGDRVYIVSDLIEGTNLAEWLLENQLTPQQAAELCVTLAEAIHHAHENHVVHRDLKPSNVLLDADKSPHLTDFGLAKRDGGEITVTIDGKILGTPAYMSPEQARGDAHNADRRSDVYSLGVMLYEFLTGERPFSSNSKLVMIQRVLHEDPRPPRKIKKTVPGDLETICLKAIMKDPARRYQTARALADDLRLYLAGKPIQARPISQVEKAWRWVRRNRSLASSLAIVALLACGLVGLFWHDRNVSATVGPLRQTVEDLSSSVEPLNKRIETLSAALEPMRHTVLIKTKPDGARVQFVSLDAKTGEPQPEQAVDAGTSPVAQKLRPGLYLVIAYLDDQRFQEVYRRVPEDPHDTPDAEWHLFWRNPAPGVVELHEVNIPDTSVLDGMARFDGSDHFVVGTDGSTMTPEHQRKVSAYYLDSAEVALRDWGASGRTIPAAVGTSGLSDDDAMAFVSWDQAVSYAELIGKRLPDEIEYEFAATRGGARQFPWGDDSGRMTEWKFEPAGETEFDRLDTNPPVAGLFSNVAEWTSTWCVLYPSKNFGRAAITALDPTRRIVRGGPASVIEGLPNLQEALEGPRARIAIQHLDIKRGIGLRCARSARPRLRPEDFGRVIE